MKSPAGIDPRYLPIFISGLIGGFAAYVIGVPMPFMLGGVFGTASFVIWYERDGAQLPKLSRWIRLVFMSIIGVMIGSRFSPEVLALLPQFWISALALIPFILLAHAGGYAIMRWLGGYEKLDAYFASLPGGIIDSVALAEAAGADLRVVTAHHPCYRPDRTRHWPDNQTTRLTYAGAIATNPDSFRRRVYRHQPAVMARSWCTIHGRYRTRFAVLRCVSQAAGTQPRPGSAGWLLYVFTGGFLCVDACRACTCRLRRAIYQLYRRRSG